MPRKSTGPSSEGIKAVVRSYRALPPHEKLLCLYAMGFTRLEAEHAVLLEMRRAAKEAEQAFEEQAKQARLKHRPNAPVVPFDKPAANEDEDDLVVKDDEDPDDDPPPRPTV